MSSQRVVYGVHSVRPDEITATEYLTDSLATADQYAAELSTDPGVLAGAVTRYVLGEPGRRTATALYVNGERQESPWISDDRKVWANARRRAPDAR